LALASQEGIERVTWFSLSLLPYWKDGFYFLNSRSSNVLNIKWETGEILITYIAPRTIGCEAAREGDGNTAAIEERRETLTLEFEESLKEGETSGGSRRGLV